MPAVLEGDPPVKERRLYPRLQPTPPTLVLFDKSKYGLLVDLCEGGLAVAGRFAQGPDGAVPLEFELPDSSECIHVQAEIVWISDSGNRTGCRFLDLPDDSRQLVKGWVSSASAARTASASRPAESKEAPAIAIESPVLAEISPEPRLFLEKSFAEQNEKFNSTVPVLAAPPPEPGSSPERSFAKQGEKFNASGPALSEPLFERRWSLDRSFAEQGEKFDSTSPVLHLVWIIVMTAVISAIAAFLLGYYWRGRELKSRGKPVASAARTAGNIAAVPPGAAGTPASIAGASAGSARTSGNTAAMPAGSARRSASIAGTPAGSARASASIAGASAGAAPQPPANAATPSVLPLSSPGIVLQVAAMDREANADALSDRLRQKNFSAYVFRRSPNKFYRVAVGPFADKVTATRIQRDLARAGYKSILRPWSPQ